MPLLRKGPRPSGFTLALIGAIMGHGHTFAGMRSQAVRGLLVYCGDYHCSHCTMISGESRLRGELD